MRSIEDTIPMPPLAATLPARPGIPLTVEALLGIPDEEATSIRMEWLNNDSIILNATSKTLPNSRWIELLNVHTGNRQFLADGSYPVPSPDGKWIAFIKDGEVDKQLWLVKSDGTEMHPLSKVQGGLSGIYPHFYEYSWSHDSNDIVLKHQAWVDPWKSSGRPNSIIEIIDVASGKSREMASLDGAVRNVTFFHHSEKLLFMRVRIGQFYNEMNDYAWIQTLSLLDGKIDTLTSFNGTQQFLYPEISPDDKNIAFLYDPISPILPILLV